MLAHPLPKAPIALTTDASDYDVGGVHEQFIDGVWQPLAFFSRQLRPTERKYSTFDRELLGLFLAVRHFRFLLEGRSFTTFVDHKPPTFAMAKVSEPWSARQQRQLSFISEFTTDVRQVADCLSRSVTSAIHLGVDYAQMAADQSRLLASRRTGQRSPACGWWTSPSATAVPRSFVMSPRASPDPLYRRFSVGACLTPYTAFRIPVVKPMVKPHDL